MRATKSNRLTQIEGARLVRALEKGESDLVGRFLNRGWNPASGIEGQNPLVYSASIKMAKLLTEAGTQLNAGKHNYTPLIAKCSIGDEEMVAFLIAAGADVNVAYSKRGCPQIPFGTTALMAAANPGYLRIVKNLLAAGAEINYIDEQGHNALFHALLSDEVEVAKHLLTVGSQLTKDVLTGPVANGNAELVRLLISKGADVNCVFRKDPRAKKGPSKETLLGYAISHTSRQELQLRGRTITIDYPVEVAELLIEAGADVNRPSPWFVATKMGRKEAIGVRPVSPLRIAGSKGLEHIMELLWKAGAKGTLKDALVDCSVEKAAFRNDIPVLKLLIKAGADLNARGYQCKTSIELAREAGNAEVVEILRRAGANE